MSHWVIYHEKTTQCRWFWNYRLFWGGNLWFSVGWRSWYFTQMLVIPGINSSLLLPLKCEPTSKSIEPTKMEHIETSSFEYGRLNDGWVPPLQFLDFLRRKAGEHILHQLLGWQLPSRLHVAAMCCNAAHQFQIDLRSSKNIIWRHKLDMMFLYPCLFFHCFFSLVNSWSHLLD